MGRWIDVNGFPGYVVNDEAEVYNEKTRKFVRASPNQQGLMSVALMRDGHQYRRALSQVVAKAFHIPAREDFNTVVHLDGSRHNCAASNLVWRARHFAIEYHKEKLNEPFPDWNQKFYQEDTEEVFDQIVVPAERYGLIQRHLRLSMLKGEKAWPVGVRFLLIEN